VFLALSIFLAISTVCQNIEKVAFDSKDSTDGYYLAIRPRSNNIKGTFVLFNSFSTPDHMLPETKLHNVAYANDLLTIFVSMKQKLYADTSTTERLNTILKHIISKYSVDTSKFILGGYDFAGNIALRYTELTNENPSQFLIHPKAVIAIDSPIDLYGLWNWSERQIKKNSESVGDAKYIIDLMTKEIGTPSTNKSNYDKLTPFNNANAAPGNERHLKNTPVRLYYDADIEWQIKRGNSLYDTNIPTGTELISRLLASDNSEAELIISKKPGVNSKGIRTTNSLSIVDEVECIHWIKNKLDIFDSHTWKPPYRFDIPKGWGVERFPIPIEFAPQINYKGVEDVRFAPGWADEKSEQYWSYTFLWWLEGDQVLDESILQKHLQAYYGGLINRNVIVRNIPSNKVIQTNVNIKKLKTDSKQPADYNGTIQMLDYMTQKPITLNFLVQVKSCKPDNHTMVFFELSPKPYSHPVWQEMHRIKDRIECVD
jgi:hypothetical protein